jgi:aspartate aminotransferase
VKIENTRAQSIHSSPSMAVSLEARRMQAEGRDIVDLSLGEPDFATPPHVIEAAYRAMTSGETRYTGPAGSEALRTAIAGKFQRENGLDYALDEIAVGNGAKQILFNLFLATLEPGDEVIVPAPYWVSYTDIVRLHGGVPRGVPCGIESGFKLTPESLAASITPRTRWLILNSPSNPSGAVYSRAEFTALGEVIARHTKIFVASDEIYEHIVWGDSSFVSFASACPALRDRTLVINGVSKAYAMTGWRLGYAAGPKRVVAALNKMQSQASTCPSSISQAAAAAALAGPQDFVIRAVGEYEARADLVMTGLATLPGLEVTPPQGAFYAYPKCAAYIGLETGDGDRIASDTDLAGFLLRSAGVATVPGAAFGLEPYLRLSFATSTDRLRTAIERMREVLVPLFDANRLATTA